MRPTRSTGRRRWWGLAGAVSALLAGAAPAAAQTDYYNTDTGRPLRVEDAYPTERHAFELQLAPLRVERIDGGVYQWSLEPELTYGVFPRTHVELGLPLAAVDAAGLGQTAGPAGLELSVLHNLNAETEGLPALGLSAAALFPVGGLAADDVYASLKAIATRTYRFARFHLNGEYTFGPDLEEPAGDGPAAGPVAEVSRWMAGLSVDRALPLRALLVQGELFAEQPTEDDADLEWTVGAGVRYQVDPRFNVDAGLGRRLTGDDEAWFFTFGTAYAFAVRSLIPVRR